MVLEQIHIPFAPELAGSVDISNHITESGIGAWVSKHWEWVFAGIAFIFIIAWALGSFDKSEPVVKEAPKPETKATPNAPFSPQQTPKA
jgi:hypothetical protein